MADSPYAKLKVQIDNGQTASSVADVVNDVSASNKGRLALCGIITPDTVTGTTLTIQPVDPDDEADTKTLTDAYGVSQTITIAADRHIALDPAIYCAIPKFKLVAGSAQGQDTEFELIYREI